MVVVVCGEAPAASHQMSRFGQRPAAQTPGRTPATSSSPAAAAALFSLLGGIVFCFFSSSNNRLGAMTTYIPSLTLPSLFFEAPAAAILLPIAAGTAVGYSTRPKETQKTYLALRQPPFRPPPWVFGPAWTFLYGAMGFAAYRAWTTGMASADANKLALAKVSISQKSVERIGY